MITEGTYGLGGLDFNIPFMSTYSEHFNTPYLWLKSGQFLTTSNSISSSGSVNFSISGLLTTNVTYLPLLSR
jgi:hypothetical protein